MSEASTAPQPAPVLLDEDERELVGLELDALLPALSDERRDRFEALADAVARGEVPPPLLPQLANLLELALQTARARRLYRAEGEKVLTGLYRRTPPGHELGERMRRINEALRSLAGHRLRSARVGMRTLGHFTVTLDTDAGKVMLAVRPDSVNVESVATGS